MPFVPNEDSTGHLRFIFRENLIDRRESTSQSTLWTSEKFNSSELMHGRLRILFDDCKVARIKRSGDKGRKGRQTSV